MQLIREIRSISFNYAPVVLDFQRPFVRALIACIIPKNRRPRAPAIAALAAQRKERDTAWQEPAPIERQTWYDI